ncbi:hypothetical protein BDY24DRAFT_442215 [Mrakia frigida]|uniref:NAD(P)-dependent alcohol dehydrogenase n=1 Tax=Mrakia frigida TaxID=29902 RepID=UPI003FCC0954
MSFSIPTTQSSWQQIARGHPQDVLRFSTDTPVLRPGKGELLVKVAFVALNPAGYKLMNFVPAMMRKLPSTPEYDLSGTVVDSSDSTLFKAGDAVFGNTPIDSNLKTGRGALCEYAVVKEEHLVHKPSTLSFEQASGMVVAGETAYESLLVTGGLKKGDRLFINGGGSSVGRFAIQIAKSVGVYVVVSCSSSSREECLNLGADETVDYNLSPLPTQLSSLYPLSSSLGFNLLLDCIGTSQALYHASHTFLLPSARYVVVGLPFPDSISSVAGLVCNMGSNLFRPTWLGGGKRKWVMFSMNVKREYLVELGRLAEEGTLTVCIDSVHGWDEAGVMAAYAKLGTGRVKGKVVILLDILDAHFD